MLSTARLFVCSVLTLAWASSPVRASEVESSRLSDDVFQSGLISYDLRDLLALHMQAMPDSGELPQLLLRRKMHLLVHESTLAGTEERREALAKANTILAEVIRNYSTDERAIEWQTTLARSLIYEQAEPYFSAILYRGGTTEDRRILADLMDQVFGVLSRLLSFLDSEYARIDELSISQYERLEKRGYIAQLETGIPQAQYMLLWSKFYMALALDSGDPQRRLLLDEVILKLSKETTLLTDKHATSHVQAQALLLAGMAHRRVADLPSAMRYLRDAQEVVGRITNSQERGDLQWVVTLGMVEHIRALRDAEKFDDATKKLANLRRRFNQTHRDDFGRKLLLANLESSIAQAIESPSSRFGRKSRTVRLSAKAVAPLIKLASKNLEYRADVYASMYERVSAASDPGLLHPFQQCALIAGHIAEAARLRQRSAADPSAPASQKFDADAMSKLEMAIDQAAQFLKEQNGQDDETTCEVQFNLAVAEYHKGLHLAASQDFARVAETCPKFARSLSAAVYAVEIITQLVEDPSLRSRQDVQAVSIYALRTLVEGFEESDSARYWRFFLAQALEDSKQFEEAAKQYNLVDRLHAHHLTAQFRTIRCQILGLRSLIERGEINTGEIHRRAGGARRAVTRFAKQAAREDPETSEDFLAQSEVMLAEMNVLKGIDRHDEAIALLSDFESKHPDNADLMGRVLRVRIIAFESTGRLKEAEQAVPRFAASDPAEAAATLQTLLDSLRKEITRLRADGLTAQADKKAKAALLFARQIYDSATGQNASQESTYLLGVQLAEANLEAGQPEAALSLFRKAEALDKTRYGDGKPHDPRLVLGLAESMARLDKHLDALALFNRLFIESPVDSPHRYPAFLGDIRCRTALGEDAAAIIDVIEQHRFLDPELGGELTKRGILEIKAKNEKRLGRR